MRKSKLSGIYYHATSTLLNVQIKETFLAERGPGDLPVKTDSKNHIKGVIVPKYKYDVSGPCAAWAYKQIAEEQRPDIYIIIGQSNKGSGITMESYETPYGIARVDQVLAKNLISKGNILNNESIFDEDDFIESQLPYIQFLQNSNLDPYKILPILVSSDIEIKKLAVDIKECLMEENKTATIIVPTNFTSYGTGHGYIPFEKDVHKRVNELDQGAIDLIQQNQPIEYLKYVDEKAMNTDNYLGILLLMLMLKPRKSFLEQYYTTADVDKNEKSFTSFASMVFK